MRSRAAAWPALAILAAIAIACARIAPLAKFPINFDGEHTYLPMARHVLEQGWAYMLSPDSLATAPFAYLYPALLGGDGTVVRWANLGLFCATIALTAWALRLEHSWRAGVVAALLLALSPAFRPFIIDVWTEPPFIFLTAVWIVAVARVAQIGPRSAPGWLWVAVGGIALAVATLTRPAAMYFAPAMVVVFGWLAWRGRDPEARRRDRRLAAMHLAATAIVAAWIVRNAITFGFPAIATGAGGALFLGINPLVDGFEPAYYGLVYDEGVISEGHSHLEVDSDRKLVAVSLLELRDTPPAVLLEMAAHKAVAFVLVTAAESSGHPLPLLRAWRVALVVLSMVAIFARPRSRLVIALGAWCAYMVAVHIPALYHHRYSVGALDLPLSALAALGVVEAAAKPVRAGVTGIALAFAVGAGLLQLVTFGFASPHVDRSPFVVVWSRPAAGVTDVRVDNGVQTGLTTFELHANAALEIPVRDAPLFHPWDMTILSVDLAFAPAPRSHNCDSVVLRYRKADDAYDPLRSRRIPIAPDGRMRTIVVGAAMPLELNHEGILRIEFDCAYPATLEMGKISITAPRRATYYRDAYLKSR